MAVNLSPIGGAAQQFFDNNGVPLAGGKIYTYAAGTTTPQATYTSSSGGTAHANPIILDSTGRVPGGELWLTAGPRYKFVIYTSADVLIGSYDNIYAIAGSAFNSRIVSVTDLGAVGDGVTDDTAPFQAASAFKVVYVPAGTYSINGTVTISIDGSHWYGDGTNASIIKSVSATAPIFSIASLSSGVTINSMKLTRTVATVAGADGITCVTTSVGKALFHDLLIEKQNIGMSLGGTDWSDIVRVTCEKCENYGFQVKNTPTDGACQWSFDTCLAQMNASHGFLFETANTGPLQMTTGTMKNCATFANSGAGVAYVGLTTIPIQGVRMVGGFHGENGGDCVYLDTYGEQHMLSNVFLELAGSRTTGPTLSTAATLTGSGLNITINNGDTQIVGCHASGNSYDGFYVNGQSSVLSGCRATNNGVVLTAGRRNGVRSEYGYTAVSGGRYGNTSGRTMQAYGVFVADGNNVTITGADMTTNTTDAWGATANATYISSVGNLPNTLNVGLAPQGAVLVGGGATGSWTAAGSINVAAGLFKNNTAYTNP